MSAPISLWDEFGSVAVHTMVACLFQFSYFSFRTILCYQTESYISMKQQRKTQMQWVKQMVIHFSYNPFVQICIWVYS